LAKKEDWGALPGIILTANIQILPEHAAGIKIDYILSCFPEAKALALIS
jgi:hypothetical protein